MKEYAILVRNGNGQPYYLDNFTTLEDAKKTLLDLITLEEERGRPYYIDNNFFNNKYNMVNKLKYMSIHERDVTIWKKCSEEKNNTTNKIIFYNFMK